MSLGENDFGRAFTGAPWSSVWAVLSGFTGLGPLACLSITWEGGDGDCGLHF